MSSPNELRLFISSTFRDLQEEREHLVKKVFPAIRSLCRSRGVAFAGVDLRWGLTEEDAMLGQVIRTCLEEIDKCRPYFIGMIGERYGKEAIVPEYANLRDIKRILGRTNILDRLAADFSSQQRAAFAAFNERADTDVTLTGPPPDPGAPGPMYVDRSTHQYDLRIVDGSGTAASKQRTASTVVAELRRRRRPPARAGAGSWRSAS